MGAWDDLLVKSQMGFRDKITGHFSLEAKILWEYDSEPADNVHRQDVDYIFGLVYEF